MKHMDRVLDLVQQLDTARAGITAVADPATRAALEEAISVVAQIAREPSWVVEVKSRDEVIGALARAVTVLQGVSHGDRGTPARLSAVGD